MSAEQTEKSIEKELRVLLLVEQLARELKGDIELQDRVAEKLGSSMAGKELRSVLLQRRAAQAYYNEEYAEALKPSLDQMIASGIKTTIEFSLANYPNKSVRTIYLSVYQAWQYLRDHDENKLLYADLYNKTQITQNSRFGVRIRPIETRAPVMRSVPVDERLDDILFLQNSITDAINKAVAEQTIEFAIIFEKKNLSLSEESQNTIKDSLAGLEGITVITTEHSVKIARRLTPTPQ